MTYNMYKDVKEEGDIMNNYEKIKSLLEKNNGILYVKELEKNNIHRQYLKILEERGEVIRVIKGLYVAPDKDINEFFIMGERYKTGIFSHNTALYFYHLTDRTPMSLDMTFPSNVRVNNDFLEPHYIKPELHSLGETTLKLEDGTNITSNIVILTTGTYLKSDILIGNTRTRSGPHNEKPSMHLSDNLKKFGFKILRLKTGTPPRIDRSTIDFTKTKREDGDKNYYTFSHTNEPVYDINNQEPCYLIYTTEETKKIIHDNLNKSSMYGGLDDITGVGPRYCPSIEDKMVRFSDKEKHQLFLEPESLYYDDIYIQGFSTSMPKEIQERMVHSLPGLEKARILRYAYAIEYDAIYPTQVKPSLETKVLNNLFTAGQINGTSGYEEAACQGLIAGINAGLKLENKDPLILKRNEAYIGVLIDDLVTKGTKEPYRMLTSRAEYRLLLRHDNSDLRLREYGHQVGLITGEKYKKFINKKNSIEELKNKLKEIKIIVDNEKRRVGISVYDYLKNPTSNLKNIIEEHNLDINYPQDVIEEVEIQIKYEGYIKKIEREAEKMLKNEEKQIPTNIDYDKIPNLASEARQKLKEVRPLNIAQAIRISGVNPADISILLVYLRKQYNE